MRIEVEVEYPEVRIATFGSVMVTVWYSEASVRGFEAIGLLHDRMVARYGAVSTINISVVLPRSPPPEALEWVKKNGERNEATTIEGVVVLLARGLSAVLARTFLATVSLFTRQKIKVVKTLEEAVTTIQQAPKQDSSIATNRQLLPALEEFVTRPAPV